MQIISRGAGAFALALSSVCTAGAWAAGVNYNVTIVSSQSSIESTTNLTVPLSGTFKGDFDAVSNPSGTKTIPGLFGGSGNNPIPYTASFVGDGAFTTNPSGGFHMLVDVEALTFTLGGLDVDFLNRDPASVDATLNVSYGNFHTQNPNAVFPSVGTVPVPLGAANLIELTAVQTGGDVAGVLLADGRNSYTFAIVVPVDLLATIEANGQIFGGTPIPFALPIAGTIVFGGENVIVTLNGTNTFRETQAIDPPATIIDQPIDIPTVLPPGGTAHLLFSGSIAELTVIESLTLDIVADAAAQLVSEDLNGDGIVGASDLAILLGAWGTSGPGDLNGDGTVGAADLTILLGAWS
ncbi:MAG: hypothetical protein SGJ11_10355 [Phycisphaerae bacterium]|nr:hypothetical protein [Phycisphaerae bacterium]